ncbi:MAG TPA: polyribonucleotide nucleotidyltransferase [Candidatus Magasanikbacteria bacterium]|nr:polyribonucleotide nucleotidyltransferase [Candidatus Magasanikbacteria bacterium]
MVQKFSKMWGGKELSIEVGRFTNQTNGSCTVQYGDTVVLATAVMSQKPREGVDFFPLMVEFEEKLYAAGIIKGSRFIKREGKASDESVLSGRMIDRAIRPLFNETMRHEVQTIVSTLSFDGENDPDILGLVAASCALAISNIPWQGPIGGIRVGQIDGEWVINPSYEAREKSVMDIVIAGTPEKVIMLEAGANEIPEDTILEAISFGQKHIGTAIDLIKEVQSAVGKEKVVLGQDLDVNDETTATDENQLLELAKTFISQNVAKYFFEKELKIKAERLSAFSNLAADLEKYLQEQNIGKDRRKFVFDNYKLLVESFITDRIINEGKRVDGRALTEIRTLTADVSLLPRTHGSALFSRGETQVLSTVTLGSPAAVQTLEGVEGTSKKRYMHHYNFPPYSVGEVGPMRGPGRREIGHGALAEKALLPVLPTKEEFPYTIRVVSEVLGSNGSSSMGSTCGSSLSLMDAGVPIKRHVAGIAMGLASDFNEGGNSYKLLTDLQDLEDGKGGMDFKVAGTTVGITAIQLDTKTAGLPEQLVKETILRSREARLQILDIMNSAIAAPRSELSPFAPRLISFKIEVDKIREVIGPGGKVINSIIDATGVEIDIEQDGTVTITAVNKEALDKAEQMVKNIVKVPEAGEIYEGAVTRLMDFGAFVEILPGKEGLVHISEMAWERTNKVEDVVKVGNIVKVQVKEIDDMGRLNLSMKSLLPKPEGFQEAPAFDRPRNSHPPRRDNSRGGHDRRPRR